MHPVDWIDRHAEVGVLEVVPATLRSLGRFCSRERRERAYSPSTVLGRHRRAGESRCWSGARGRGSLDARHLSSDGVEHGAVRSIYAGDAAR